MIPEKLTIEGLYSYQKAQQIDFDRLTQAQIFGIFGATGSGKSSILEAISLALYGECERLGRNNRNYNLMNLRSRRLYIDFIFRIEQAPPLRYRFTVEGKRHKSQFEKVSTYQRQAYRQEGPDWIPLDLDTAESLIQLSYDNFKRTLIIPQGRFQEFLSLKPGERSNMLKEIFGLEKYELYDKTQRLISHNQLALENHRARLQQYAEVSEEKIRETSEEIRRKNQEASTVAQQLHTCSRALENMERLQQWIREREAYLQEKTALEAKTPEMKAREQRLDEYVICLNTFSQPIHKHKDLSQELAKVETRLASLHTQHAALSQTLTREEQTFAQVEENYLQRDTLRQKAEELGRLQALRDTQTMVGHLEGRKTKGEATVRETERTLESLKSQLAQKRQALKALQEGGINMEELMAVREWFSQQQVWQTRWHQKQQEKTQLAQEVADARQEKERLMAQAQLDPRQQSLNIQQVLKYIAAEIDRETTRRVSLIEDQQRQAVIDHLAGLAEGLEPGTPCPLCGSSHHPQPASFEAENAASLAAKISQTDQRINLLREIRPQIEGLVKQALKVAQRQKSLDQALLDLETEARAHKSAFAWPNFDPEQPERISTLLEQAAEHQQQIKQAELDIEALTQSIEAEEKVLPSYRQTLQEIQDQLSQKKGFIQSQQQQFRHIDWKAWDQASAEQIQAAKVAETHKFEEITSLYANMKEQIRIKSSNLDEMKGEMGAGQLRKKELTRSLAQLQQQLDEILATTHFPDLERVRQLLNEPLNMDEEKQALRLFAEKLTELNTRLEEITKKLGNQTFSPETLQQLQQERDRLSEQANALNQYIGGLKNQVVRLEKELVEKQQLQDALTQLEQREANLKVLRGLFKGSGFVNYLSTIYLENLCAIANQRFLRLTRNALSLEVDAHNQFHVRDRLNEGRLRSISTLSGGQTFQAALCLALSLAEQVQTQVQAKENFFFLDEGFGSQDKESLRTIFQTLKALRQEHRMVGVISHVEELQQEIDTFLFVENHPETGSKISPSWK